MKALIKKGLVAATACAAAILGCALIADRTTAQEDFLAENDKIVALAEETDEGGELVYHIDGTTAAACKTQWDTAVAASTGGKVVTVILDVDWSGAVSSLPEATGKSTDKKNIILDLNGHTISYSGSAQTRGVISTKYTNLTINNGTVTGGYLIGGYYGAGVGVHNGDLILNNVTITGNKGNSTNNALSGLVCVYGVGVAVENGSLTMNGGSVSNNTCSGANYVRGIGVYVKNGTFAMNGGSISNNSSVGICDRGGGVYLYNCPNSSIQNGTISGNKMNNDSTNSEGLGGGICADGTSTLEISENSTISENQSKDNGAGIYARNSLTIKNSQISGNVSKGGYGGGIFLYSNTNGTIENCEITGNKANSGNAYGGGIYSGNGSLNINGCTISKNETAQYGGGIYAYSNGSFSLTDCTVTENKAGTAGGGVHAGGQKTFSGKVIISGNTITSSGAASDLFSGNFSNKIDVTMGLSAESRIGVERGTVGSGAAITTGFGAGGLTDKDLANIFSCNTSGYLIASNGKEGNELEATIVKPQTVKKPTAPSTKFTYNGKEQTFNLSGINTSYMTVEGNVQTDAGTHTVTVSLKNGGVWEDLTTTDETYEFVIAKATTTIAPSQASYTVKEGNEYTVTATASSGETVTIEYYNGEGKLDGAPTAVGSYTVKFSVDESDNYLGAQKTVQLTISAHDHVWGEYTYNEDATCEKDGTETATCTFEGCDATNPRDKSGTKLNHSFTVYVPNNDATCTKNGSETAVCDNGCGKEEKRTIADSKTEHSYESVVTEATCTKKGNTVNTCSVCGYKETVGIDAKGHDYSQERAENPWVWAEDYSTAKVYITCSRCNDVVEVEAEVTDNGSQKATCSSSGYIDVSASATYEDHTFEDAQYKNINPTAHKYEITDFVWAEDYSKATLTYLCSECEIVGDSVEGTVEIKENSDADCENDGFITYTVTIGYGNEQSETKEETVKINALQHEYEEKVTAPTCTEEGYTTYTCTREGCNYSYVGDAKVAATGHTYEEGKYSYDEKEHWQVCTVCEKDGEKTAHTYEQKEVKKEATDTENGEALWACACGSEITKTIPMLAHTEHTKGEELKSNDTHHWYECTFDGCEVHINEEEHDFGDWESGEENHWKTCSVCSQKTTAEAHDFSEWEETTAATCEEQGEKKHACSVCGYEEKRAIDPLGHLIEDDPTWEWSDNYHAATATFVCKNGGSHEVTVAATVTENKEDATCTKEGLLSLLASVTLNEEEYTDEKKDVITTLPHKYALTGWEWAEDHSSASVTVECSVCEHSETADAKIKKNGEYTFIATATVEGVKFTDTVTVDPPAPSDKTVVDGTWNVNGEVPKFEGDNSNRVFVTYYDQDGNAVTELKMGATYSAVITLKDSSNYEFAKDLQTVKTFTAKLTTTIDPDPDNPNYKVSANDGTGDEPEDSAVMAYVPMGLSGVSVVLIIAFAIMTYNNAAAAKSAKAKAKRIASTSYSFAPIGLLALVFGITQASWWVIAGILMGCALIMGIVAIMFNGKKRRALEALEEEQENARANEKVRREDEMRMMFAAMQQNSQQPQMNYGDMRSVIQETVAALLPGLQQLQALPPASQDNAEGVQGDIDGLQAKMEEQQELLTQILENQQNYVMPLYEDELEDDLTWLGESEETVSLEESYGALNDEGKQAYYDIGSYIINKPRVSQNDGKYAVLFKYRGKTVFKLVIKEDAPVLYYPSNDGGVKSEVRVADASAVELAKGIIDGVIVSADK